MNLGAKERPVDTRDIQLGAVQAPLIIPDVFLPDVSWLTRNYQGQTPYCGAHASSHFNALLQQADIRTNPRFSPRYSWIKIKQIDGFPLEDGTDMRSIFKSLQSGSCDYALAGNDISLPIEQYSSPAFLTSAMDDNAQPNIIKAYGFTDAPTFQEIKQAIFKNGQAILLLKVDEGFWGTTTPTFSTGQWGHFVTADGYTATSIRIIDSADPNDALATKFIDQQYITPTYFREMGTALDVPNWQVILMTSEIGLLKKVVALYRKLIQK